MLGFLLCETVTFASAEPAAADRTSFQIKHVLVLLPADASRPEMLAGLASLEQELRRSGPENISIRTETVNLRRGFESELRAAAARHARSTRMSAIVAVDPLVEAGARIRDEFWPGVPLVYVTRDDNFQPPASSTGVISKYNFEKTLRLAFELFPEARRLVIAGGASEAERAESAALAGMARATRSNLGIIDMGGLTVLQMKERIAAMPRDSLILVTGSLVDGNMHEFTEPQLVSLFAPVSAAPIFSLRGISVGMGAVGGLGGTPAEELGREAGKIILRLARGEPLASIRPVSVKPKALLDWRQLERFEVPAARIPQGVEVLYRQPTVWESHRELIVLVAIAVLVQTLLILILFAEQRNRRAAQRSLAERLRYEHFISEISAGFANLPPGRLDEQIVISLQKVTAFLEGEQTTLWRYRQESEELERVRFYAVPELATDAPPRLTLTPDLSAVLLEGNPARIEDASSLQTGTRIRSALSLPLMVAGRLVGCLTCATFTTPRKWPDSMASSVQAFGELFANVLALEESERTAREGEALNSAVLASLPGYVAILDQEGTVLRVNDAWKRAHGTPNPPPFVRAMPGASYLQLTRSPASSEWDTSELQALVAFVLSGERADTVVEIHQSAFPEQWFEVRIGPLQRPGGGAVVSHVDITAKKRAEAHETRNSATIVQMNRFAAVSELATAIAHELNQPLGAISVNAKAAEMQLRAHPAGSPEALLTLADIASDTRRAGEIIARIRALLKKQQRATVAVRVNEVVEKVLRLIRRDALLRQVDIRTELCADSPVVVADPVQLQQVLLNLAANAMDAMSANPPEGRIVTIRTLRREKNALIEVEDRGCGIAQGTHESIFDSFYTTKANGLGVGLSVSRSIIEADGGQLWAEDRRGGGAIFRCSIPLCEDRVFNTVA